tara:strand:- start:25 stop:924 length:900 start_codon:yes stop_codon:yes gene_type:complete
LRVTYYLFLICSFSFLGLKGQDTLGINKKRLKTVIVTESVLYVGTMGLLATQWYSKEDRRSFHLFNDNKQWLQLDKVGHVFSAYQTGRLGIDVLKWAKVDDKKAAIYGGSLGFLFLSGVEVLDGFSEEWGFSWGDFGANAIGAGMAISQELIFGKQIALVKFSYHPTDFREYRPNVLGESEQAGVLKDYNGQTYWLSLNLKDVTHADYIPAWLSISGGYSGTGMFGGSENPTTNSNGLSIPNVNRYRQYYISLDIDLERIPTKSKFLKTAFKAMNFIKVPLPTVRFQDGKAPKFYPFYF